MVKREKKMRRWQILGCAMALGLSLSPALAAQTVQVQAAPGPQISSSPNAGAASEVSPASAPPTATAPASASAKNFFHVKYVSEGAIYLDAGRNEMLEEGMLLHVVHADPGGGTTDAVRFQGQEPLASV